MYRKAIEQLLEWKNKKEHKPLILQGARQVGKTWLMKEFGKKYYKQVAYITFDTNETARQIFTKGFNIERIITELSLAVGFKINSDDTLIILDEVQECPQALTSLKYFNENAPEYDIIAAGSYLGVAHHEGTGFPVGKVEFIKLYPLDFTEFLMATGNERFIEPVKDKNFDTVSTFKTDYEYLLKQYLYIGGMPDVVQDFVQKNDFNSVREKQNLILETYEQDFSKHIQANVVEKIRMLWHSIPSQLAKENKKFIYNAVKKGARAKDFELALAWLRDTGLIYKIHRVTKPAMPLIAYEDFDVFKIYILDVGLLGALAHLDAQTLIDGNKIFEEFNGTFAEQYVLQRLKAIPNLPIYYWSNERSKGEIDYIIQYKNEIIPIEVKATINLKAKSLSQFRKEFEPNKSIRTSLADYEFNNGLYNIPLYAINFMKDVIG